MTFGEAIAKRRKELGLTQKDLAKLLNRYEKTVGNWERDKNLPDEKMRREVCRLLGIDPKLASLEYDRELLKDEQKIIYIYRELDEESRKLLYQTAITLEAESIKQRDSQRRMQCYQDALRERMEESEFQEIMKKADASASDTDNTDAVPDDTKK